MRHFPDVLAKGMLGLKKQQEKPPTVMPDPTDPAIQEAERKRAKKMKGMGGRSSTILSDSYAGDTMGGG